jgi:hypothetical protein
VAADALRVNWNEQAVRATESHLSSNDFSCKRLIDQLQFERGNQCTREQATFGAQQTSIADSTSDKGRGLLGLSTIEITARDIAHDDVMAVQQLQRFGKLEKGISTAHVVVERQFVSVYSAAENQIRGI